MIGEHSRSKGLAVIADWLEGQRSKLDVSKAATPAGAGSAPALYCPQCKSVLGAFLGRHSGKYRILHHSHPRCRLSFRSWVGDDRGEALGHFMQFSYGYRSEESAVELPESDGAGAEAPNGEGGCLAIGGGGETPDEGGEGATDDINRLLEDAGSSGGGAEVWEEEYT